MGKKRPEMVKIPLAKVKQPQKGRVDPRSRLGDERQEGRGSQSGASRPQK